MQRDEQAGFTLIEAVIAALILLVAIVFVAQLFVTALRQNATSRESTHATAIAQSKIEELNAMPIEQLRYGGDLGPKRAEAGAPGVQGYSDYVAVDDSDTDRIGVVASRDKANYVRYWKVEPDPGGWQGVYRISVRVVTLTAERQGEEATLSTVRAQF